MKNIFLGHSTESARLADAMQDQFEAPLYCGRASDKSGFCSFRVNHSHLDNLIRVTNQVDFAVFLLTPDDDLTHRDKNALAPRDNVILELGLFMGALGKERTFFVAPGDHEIKLPSDLQGITPITYSYSVSKANPGRAVQAACRQIKQLIDVLPPLQRKFDGQPREATLPIAVPTGMLIAQKLNKQINFQGSFVMQKRVVALANGKWDETLNAWKISEQRLSELETALGGKPV
ncbi:TIR domain-containing protein [Rhizobium tubonense]|nr:nucleotide-binding protein [Rhizobium tubonense]